MNADFFIFICECETSKLRAMAAEVEKKTNLQFRPTKVIHYLGFMQAIEVVYGFEFDEYAIDDLFCQLGTQEFRFALV